MLDTVDAGLARVRAEAEDEIPLPEGATSLHFMQAIYRDPRQPMTRRMKAAMAALPFEHPKLGATYAVKGERDFAAEMRAIAMRSGKPYYLDGHVKHIDGKSFIKDAEGNWVEDPRDTRPSQPLPQLPAGESKMPPFRRRL
jgi:hypothetical protein